jgi:hypothetical protein
VKPDSRRRPLPQDPKRRPADLKKLPIDLKKPPADLKNLPMGLKRTPADLEKLPVRLKSPPADLTRPKADPGPAPGRRQRIPELDLPALPRQRSFASAPRPAASCADDLPLPRRGRLLLRQRSFASAPRTAASLPMICRFRAGIMRPAAALSLNCPELYILLPRC